MNSSLFNPLQTTLPGVILEEERISMPSERRRVLVAEQDETLRNALLRELVRRGFDVTATGRPDVARRLLRFVDVAVVGECFGTRPALRAEDVPRTGSPPVIVALGSAVAPDEPDARLQRESAPTEIADVVEREHARLTPSVS